MFGLVLIVALVSTVIVGTVIGLGLVTSTTAAFRWVGYLLGPFGGKTGAIGSSSIGILIAFVIGAVVYAVLALARARSGRAAGTWRGCSTASRVSTRARPRRRSSSTPSGSAISPRWPA